MNKTYRENYAAIDWSGTPEWKPAQREQPGPSTYFMPDIAPFVSPLDHSVISSRSGLRDHEKRHGVKQVGNDYKASDYDAAKTRGSTFNERRLEGAYRTALEKAGL